MAVVLAVAGLCCLSIGDQDVVSSGMNLVEDGHLTRPSVLSFNVLRDKRSIGVDFR